MTAPERDRVLGALVGIAYGDAFGMPVEMFSRKAVADRLGAVDRFMPGCDDNPISHGLAAGETTDDTQNALFVIEMLEEAGGEVDPALFVAKVRHWAETSEKSVAVIGPSTARAFTAIDAGTPMEEAGKSGTTNGSAMKVAPLGIVFGGDEQALLHAVHMLSMPTHNTGQAISAAAALAAAVGAAVRGQGVGGALDAAERAADAGARLGCFVPGPSVAARLRLARTLCDDAAARGESPERTARSLAELFGTGLPAVDSVPTAIGLALASGGDPVPCARLATAQGGDTDTVASMACSLCGALSGAAAFPQRDVELLERVNGIDFEDLADRACRLARGRS